MPILRGGREYHCDEQQEVLRHNSHSIRERHMVSCSWPDNYEVLLVMELFRSYGDGDVNCVNATAGDYK